MYVRVWRLAWPGLTYNLKSSRFIVFTFYPTDEYGWSYGRAESCRCCYYHFGTSSCRVYRVRVDEHLKR